MKESVVEEGGGVWVDVRGSGPMTVVSTVSDKVSICATHPRP